VKFLLDTNTLIYYFKGQGHVAEKLLAVSPRDLAVSTVSLHELETGLRKSSDVTRRRQQLAAFLAACQVWEFDQSAAEVSAEIRADLESQGTPIGPLDNLIAGIAYVRGATLVTRNLREFARVRGLMLVDWYG
jgi:tRNA(fMet)-specific endonuclease VapC